MKNKEVTEKLLDTIEKLQNMTTENGCTEAEAMAAAARIGDILTKHNLSMDSVSERLAAKSAFDAEAVVDEWVRNDFQEEWGNKRRGKQATFSDDSYMWLTKLARGIAELCFCEYSGSSSKGFYVWFLGQPDDVAVAKKLYPWLRDQLLIIAGYEREKLDGPEKYVPQNVWYKSWLLGCSDRLLERVREEIKKRESTEETFALVVDKAQLIKDWKKEQSRIAMEKYNAQVAADAAAGVKQKKVRARAYRPGPAIENAFVVPSVYQQGRDKADEIPLYITPQVE